MRDEPSAAFALNPPEAAWPNSVRTQLMMRFEQLVTTGGEGDMIDQPNLVIDTNVIVSGLLSAVGPPGRLIDMVLAGRIRLTVDDRVVAGYRAVLSRPKFQIDEARREAFLAVLQFQDYTQAGP